MRAGLQRSPTIRKPRPAMEVRRTGSLFALLPEWEGGNGRKQRSLLMYGSSREKDAIGDVNNAI